MTSKFNDVISTSSSASYPELIKLEIFLSIFNNEQNVIGPTRKTRGGTATYPLFRRIFAMQTAKSNYLE
jgi:hypothetical protein